MEITRVVQQPSSWFVGDSVQSDTFIKQRDQIDENLHFLYSSIKYLYFYSYYYRRQFVYYYTDRSTLCFDSIAGTTTEEGKVFSSYK